MDGMRFYDAHNHLQDDRFGRRQDDLLTACQAVRVARMVVNGACEADWPQVLALAQAHPRIVLPSFGYHPWYARERTADWQASLVRFLDAIPSAVGEIGLDRWKPGLDYEGQEEVFAWQLRLAAQRNVAASIHCLQAWGRLHELLRAGPLPRRGFLLHSYGGPVEMVASFVKLGACFSFPGFFAFARKQRQRAAFLAVPPDRLLVETDAPDQPLPDPLDAEPDLREALMAAPRHRLPPTPGGKPLNHPANLPAVYRCLAALRGESLERLAAQVEENFHRLFG